MNDSPRQRVAALSADLRLLIESEDIDCPLSDAIDLLDAIDEMFAG